MPSSYQRLLAKYKKEQEKNRQLTQKLNTLIREPDSYQSYQISAQVQLKLDLENSIYFGECHLENYVDHVGGIFEYLGRS